MAPIGTRIKGMTPKTGTCNLGEIPMRASAAQETEHTLPAYSTMMA